MPVDKMKFTVKGRRNAKCTEEHFQKNTGNTVCYILAAVCSNAAAGTCVLCIYQWTGRVYGYESGGILPILIHLARCFTALRGNRDDGSLSAFGLSNSIYSGNQQMEV